MGGGDMFKLGLYLVLCTTISKETESQQVEVLRAISTLAKKNNLCIIASYFYLRNEAEMTYLLKNYTFTNFKKCDKIYLKLIDTKINYNSSQLTASVVT